MLRQSISILFNYFLASHFALVEILFFYGEDGGGAVTCSVGSEKNCNRITL